MAKGAGTLFLDRGPDAMFVGLWSIPGFAFWALLTSSSIWAFAQSNGGWPFQVFIVCAAASFMAIPAALLHGVFRASRNLVSRPHREARRSHLMRLHQRLEKQSRKRPIILVLRGFSDATTTRTLSQTHAPTVDSIETSLGVRIPDYTANSLRGHIALLTYQLSFPFLFLLGPKPSRLTMEDRLVNAFGGSHDLVAVGATNIDVGSSSGLRFVDAHDAEWRQIVAAFAERAQFIVMFAAPSPSAASELAWLLSNDALKSKLLISWPPRANRPDDHDLDIWLAVRRAGFGDWEPKRLPNSIENAWGRSRRQLWLSINRFALRDTIRSLLRKRRSGAGEKQ